MNKIKLEPCPICRRKKIDLEMSYDSPNNINAISCKCGLVFLNLKNSCNDKFVEKWNTRKTKND